MRPYLFAIAILAASACSPKHGPSAANATTGMTAGEGAPPPGGTGEGGGGGGPVGPSCEAAASKVIAIPNGVSKRPLTDDQMRMAKVAFVERCTEDKWTEDTQKCLIAASSRDELRACRDALPKDARKALGKDLRERLGRTHTGDTPDGSRGVKMSADPCEGGE